MLTSPLGRSSVIERHFVFQNMYTVDALVEEPIHIAREGPRESLVLKNEIG